MERRYEISHVNVTATVAKAKKIAARAKAKGLLGGYTVRTETTTETNEFGSRVVRTFLVIDGEPIAYGGWRFVAKAERLGDAWIVSGSPWYEGPQVDRDTLKANWCDECRRTVHRSKVIVVENEAGERRQVGSACVDDFLGHTVSAAWLLTGGDGFSEFGGFSGGVFTADLHNVLTLAATAIRVLGFTSKAAADETKTPTATMVQNLLGWNGMVSYSAAWKRVGQTTDADRATADAALQYGKSMTGSSDYAQNVAAFFNNGDWVDARKMGLVVSVVGVFVREQAEAVAKPKVEDVPAPVGRVMVSGTVLSFKCMANPYGPGDVLKFRVRDDRGFTVWSTVPAAIDNVESGDRVEFTATLTRSDRDETFAFASRPTKARILQAA